jgi:hypothetical protein
MGIFSFKTQSPKRFEYPPRYYNPEKESFDARMRRIKSEVDAEEAGEESTHTISIRDAYDKLHRRKSKGTAKPSKIRLFIVISTVILLIVFFYLFGILFTYLMRNV